MNFTKIKLLKIFLIIFNFIIFFLVIFIKWLISFYYFQNDNLINKLIFDIEDFYYYPHIINLIEFDFSPDYLNNFPSQNSLPIPIYSIFIHAFYKIVWFCKFHFFRIFMSLSVFTDFSKFF